MKKITFNIWDPLRIVIAVITIIVLLIQILFYDDYALIPWLIWGIIMLTIFGIIVYTAIKYRK
jgi:membrane protein YdbS with pleckstrin-like domain